MITTLLLDRLWIINITQTDIIWSLAIMLAIVIIIIAYKTD
jgi:hypothetical protein